MRNRRTAKSRVRPDNYQRLEPRHLLATFGGTDGPDVVHVTFEAGVPTTVEINGEQHNNPDETLTLQLGDNHLFGQPDETPDQIFLHGMDFEVALDINGASINDGAVRINVLGSMNLTTDSGNDTIHGSGIRETRSFSIDTGEGDDVFNYHGGEQNVSMGSGNDRLVSWEHGHLAIHRGAFDAGDGWDTWEIANENYDHRLNIESEQVTPINGHAVTPLKSLENFIGSDSSNSRIILHESGRIVVDGSQTIYTTVSGKRYEFQNHGWFEGLFGTEDTYVAQVLATDQPMTFRHFNNLTMGGDFQNGDTSRINHDIGLSMIQSLAISNSSSTDPMEIQIGRASGYQNQIMGLTRAILHVNFTVRHINIAGSQADDRFLVSQNDSHIILFGNEGDDRFIIGSNDAIGGGDLSIAGKVVNIVGGEGDDIVRAIDTNSETARRFRVRDHWIFSAGDSPNRDFQGISFHEVERTNLEYNSLTERVWMTPSDETVFSFFGTDSGQSYDDVFIMIPPFEQQGNLIRKTATGEYIWVFSDMDFRFIYTNHLV